VREAECGSGCHAGTMHASGCERHTLAERNRAASVPSSERTLTCRTRANPNKSGMACDRERMAGRGHS
jgi:hypothetical protein